MNSLPHCLYLILLRMLNAPDRCFHVQVEDTECITFAKTPGAARWNAVRAAWDAGYFSYRWPSVTAKRYPEGDRSHLARNHRRQVWDPYYFATA
jgi:hypothetical protein